MSGYPDVALPGGSSLPASVAQSPLLFQNGSYQFLDSCLSNSSSGSCGGIKTEVM